MKFKKFSRASLMIGLLASIPFAIEIKKDYFTKNISNLSELARIIQEEELNIFQLQDKKEVYWTFGKTPWHTAASAKIRENTYLVILDEDKNRFVIRHELHHIYAGHCDQAFKIGKWNGINKFLDEATARLYSTYNLRL